jgi:hypothetical protein
MMPAGKRAREPNQIRSTDCERSRNIAQTPGDKTPPMSAAPPADRERDRDRSQKKRKQHSSSDESSGSDSGSDSDSDGAKEHTQLRALVASHVFKSSSSHSSHSHSPKNSLTDAKHSKHSGGSKKSSKDGKEGKESKEARRAAKKARKAEKKLKKKLLKEAKRLVQGSENISSSSSAAGGGADSAISEEHYFAKNAELRVWLLEKKVYFDELTGDEQKNYFKKFVVAWNSRALPERFYKGIDHSKLSTAQRTTFQWGFAKKLNENTVMQLESGMRWVQSVFSVSPIHLVLLAAFSVHSVCPLRPRLIREISCALLC